MAKTLRESRLVSYGRIFQKFYSHFSTIDYIARFLLLSKQSIEYPVVCIVAPPRSGSTLSYQVLISGIDNIHLTNLWHILYATPALGSFLSRCLCKSYRTEFRSQQGLVPGLCGEAEGRNFWIHWGGQKLMECGDNLNIKRLIELSALLKRICNGRAFITGYPGHALYMHMMRQAFSQIIFIHITRDLISNAFSLLKSSQNGWFSATPNNFHQLNFDTLHERVVAQLFSIHERILQQSDSSDTLQCSYRDICHTPDIAVDRIIDFAKARGIKLVKKGPVPLKTKPHVVNAHQDRDSIAIDRYIKTYLYKSVFQSFFSSLC